MERYLISAVFTVFYFCTLWLLIACIRLGVKWGLQDYFKDKKEKEKING